MGPLPFQGQPMHVTDSSRKVEKVENYHDLGSMLN